MTKAELVNKIENGNDIMFSVVGKHFTILTWPDEGIAIGEQNSKEKPRYFDTPEELVEQFTVDGRSLGELSSKIVITQYT